MPSKHYSSSPGKVLTAHLWLHADSPSHGPFYLETIQAQVGLSFSNSECHRAAELASMNIPGYMLYLQDMGAFFHFIPESFSTEHFTPRQSR